MAQAESWTLEGWKKILDQFFKISGTDSEDLELIFFSNNFTPTVNTQNSDLTVINDNGLENQDLVRATWQSADDDGNDIVYSDYDTNPIVLNITGTQNCYGWAIRGKTSNVIYYAKNHGLKSLENSDTVTMNNFNMRIKIVPS